MHDNIPPELERYLALCKRIYEDMERDGTWPWKNNSNKRLGLTPPQADSTDRDDVVESEHNSDDI